MSESTGAYGFSRRKFMGLAGCVAGYAAISRLGVPEGWAQNTPDLGTASLELRESQTDVLVVGGGIAGLFAAVKAHDAGARVLMVVKGGLGSSGQTPFARGIFSYDPDTADVSLDEFTDTVSRSALGTNNPVYTRQMAEHSRARVEELREWGFFGSPLFQGAFRRPLDERDIPILERVMVTRLLEDGGRIVGVAGFAVDSGDIHVIRARSVILCTGAGGFKPNGFPICDLTHDGTVMAYDIGARVTGKEWNDGHFARSNNPAACFDGWQQVLEQNPSVTGVEVRHDLGVDMNYIAYTSGNPVRMGRPGSRATSDVEGGPYVPDEFRNSGGPPGPPPGHDGRRSGGRPPEDGPPGFGGDMMGGASAGMSIHKSEGLVPVDDRCATDIRGLYAAGDALGSYMAGAIYTQIGSSLAGSSVQGAIAGEAAAEYSRDVDLPDLTASRMSAVREEMLAPLERESGYAPAWVTQVLQGIMIPNFVIYIKTAKMLEAALAYVEELRDHHVPMLRAGDLHELRLAHETRNMVISAEMKLRASLMRTESRCSHYRIDHPEVDDENWRAWINIRKGADGEMQLEKQGFDQWPS